MQHHLRTGFGGLPRGFRACQPTANNMKHITHALQLHGLTGKGKALC
jgi:hypothetical protein